VLNATAVADAAYLQIRGEIAVKAAGAAAWFPVTAACKVNFPAADDSADQTWEKDRRGLKMCGRESWQKAQHLEIIFRPLLWDFFTLMIALSHTYTYSSTITLSYSLE